jgi:drug/metabolite transporter (DMT)-like permease
VTRSALPRIRLLALIWGSAFLWIKLADRGFSPVEVTLARLVLGAGVLFVIVAARREHVPRSVLAWAHIAVAALFANAVPYPLFAVAEQHVPSSTAGIINATTPLWTAVLAPAVRHQKAMTSWQAAGLIVGFAGAVLIFTPWNSAAGLTSAGGVECLAASISYAVSYIYMDKYLARRGIGPVVLSACQLLAAALMLVIALAVVGVRTPHLTAESVAAVAVLGIIGTGFAYVLNYQIITSEGATIASTVTYLLPVVAIVLGVLVLGESVTAIVLVGIALVLAGVALTRRRVKAKRATTGQETRTGDPVSDDGKKRTDVRRVQKVTKEGRESRFELPARNEDTEESAGPGQRVSDTGQASASRSASLKKIRLAQRASEPADESTPPQSPERDTRDVPGDWPGDRCA